MGTTSKGDTMLLQDGSADSNSNDESEPNPNIAAFRKAVQKPSGLPLELDFQYEMRQDHYHIQSVWDEWFGQGDFDPILDSDVQCYRGGVGELENKFKNKWRPAYNNAKNKQLSRCKNIVGCILIISQKTQKDTDDVLRYVDTQLKSLLITQVTPMLKYLQRNKEEIITTLTQD